MNVRMPGGLSNVKRAELIGHLAELDQMIEHQTAHVAIVVEMGLLVPVMTVRLERLKELRRLYSSALQQLVGGNGGDDGPGKSRPDGPR